MELLQLKMSENKIVINSFKAWIFAARPKTLTGAAVPVMIGAALALNQTGLEQFAVIPAILCFLFAFIMQIDANFINDYFDCKKGNDNSETRLGPKRACTEGWITLPAMKKAIIMTTILAGIIGLPLIIYGGYGMILIGLLCVVFCFLYTTKFSYLGLGDLLVLIFFGIIPVCFTYYIAMPQTEKNIPLDVFLASLACGFVIDTLLIVNNYRDRDNDRRDGKITLIVRVGEKWGARLYLLSGLIGEILMLFVSKSYSESTFAPTLLLGYLLLHFFTYERMLKIRQGKELNKVLGMTARNMFIFGILSTLAILI